MIFYQFLKFMNVKNIVKTIKLGYNTFILLIKEE